MILTEKELTIVRDCIEDQSGLEPELRRRCS